MKKYLFKQKISKKLIILKPKHLKHFLLLGMREFRFSLTNAKLTIYTRKYIYSGVNR